MKRPVAFAVVVLAAAGGASVAADKPPKGLPDTTESAKLIAKMPKTVSGRVWVDRNGNKKFDSGEGLIGARVTDGVDFVPVDSTGAYSITIKPDPVIPYTPSRTVSVSWPDGVWPVRAGWTGTWGWHVRLKDIKDPRKVDFRFVPVGKTQWPMCLSFATDPHDYLRRPQNAVYRDEVAAAGQHVQFSVMGGDLGYFGFANADTGYTSIAQFTGHFPHTLFHIVGNHDVVGIHSTWWKVPHENAGNGAFTKYLNPVRWSFTRQGIHFIGMDWAHEGGRGFECGTADSAAAWMEKDLKSLPKGTPTYLFVHMWSGNTDALCQKYGVKLLLAGHSHRNICAAPAGPGRPTPLWTKMSLYTLLYIDKKGDFEFVDRCIYKGGRRGWDGHWRHSRRACALLHDWPQADKGYPLQHNGVKDVVLTDGTKTLKPVDGATYDLRIGAAGTGRTPAKRYGLRLVPANGEPIEFAYVDRNRLDLMGLKTYFNRVMRFADQADEPEKWLEMRIIVMPDRVRVIVNSRLHYEKFITPGQARKIEIFATGGSAEFARADVWQRDWTGRKIKRTANTP